MKTVKIFMLMIATACCITSFAQTADPRGKFLVGVKAGVNYSNVYDSQGEDFEADSKLGFVGGLFMSIPIGKFIGIQPEVLFSQKGFHGKGMLLGNTYELTRTTSFIDVPLLFAIKPAKQISILGGPQFSYLLEQRDVFTNSIGSVQEEEFKNANIRKNTMCLLGGFDINLHPVVLSGRAGWDIQNNHGDGTSTTPRYKNAWVQATLGFRF